MGRRDVENMLVIGDSLTSDIKGGNNVGIDTLWFNPHRQENTKGVHVEYEADSLEKIGKMLGAGNWEPVPFIKMNRPVTKNKTR